MLPLASIPCRVERFVRTRVGARVPVWLSGGAISAPLLFAGPLAAVLGFTAVMRNAHTLLADRLGSVLWGEADVADRPWLHQIFRGATVDASVLPDDARYDLLGQVGRSFEDSRGAWLLWWGLCAVFMVFGVGVVSRGAERRLGLIDEARSGLREQRFLGYLLCRSIAGSALAGVLVWAALFAAWRLSAEVGARLLGVSSNAAWIQPVAMLDASIWIGPLLAAAWAAFRSGRDLAVWARWRRKTSGLRCNRCGYPAASPSGHVCPECGSEVNAPRAILAWAGAVRPLSRGLVVGSLALALAYAIFDGFMLTPVAMGPAWNLSAMRLCPPSRILRVDVNGESVGFVRTVSTRDGSFVQTVEIEKPDGEGSAEARLAPGVSMAISALEARTVRLGGVDLTFCDATYDITKGSGSVVQVEGPRLVRLRALSSAPKVELQRVISAFDRLHVDGTTPAGPAGSLGAPPRR